MKILKEIKYNIDLLKLCIFDVFDFILYKINDFRYEKMLKKKQKIAKNKGKIEKNKEKCKKNCKCTEKNKKKP